MLDNTRFEECYNFLVDETENRQTIYNKKRSELLRDLLEIFEYLQGDDSDNPLLALFPSDGKY